MAINRKLKECKGYGTKEPHQAYLWSGGRCKHCNALKVADKEPEKVLGTKANFEAKEQSPIKRSKLSANQKKALPLVKKAIKMRTKKNQKEKKAEDEAGRLYWESMANEKGEVHCEETGDFLGLKEEFNKACLAHVLSKGAYSKFRDDPRNFIVIKFELHDILDAWADRDQLRETFKNIFYLIDHIKEGLKLEYSTKGLSIFDREEVNKIFKLN